MATASTIPKLASDLRRGWISILMVVPVTLATGPLVLRGRTLVVGSMAQLLLVWVCFAVFHLALTLLTYRGLRGERLRIALLHGDRVESRMTQRLLRRPFLRTLITGGDAAGWAVQMSVVAFCAALALAINDDARSDLLVVLLGVLSVVGCWCTVLISYAVQYAREQAHRGGLLFPGEEPTTLGAFIYLAVMVSTSFGTSDVHVLTQRMRRIVMTHSLVCFAYNTIIVAILVSVLIGALM